MHTNSDPASPSPARNVPPPAAFQGSFRLLRLAGADVFVHWSWFLVAYFLIRDRPVKYSSLTWDIAEYVAGFGIVLMHEFGHVFACRSVGGIANRVLLWPLGGLAFVATPPRPGANLWTTAAGPLVNVFLAPVLIGLALTTAPNVEGEAASDLYRLFDALAMFNVVMLVFNLLPIFPLDGGQILHSLLWFCLGRARGLAIAAGIGLVAAAALLVLAVSFEAWWLALMSGFLLLSAFNGLKQARALLAWNRIERRTDLECPHCHCAPRVGVFWQCGRCQSQIDAFQSFGSCPNCNSQVAEILCLDCGKTGVTSDWITGGPPPTAEPSAMPMEGWITSEDYPQPPKPSS